MYFPVADVTVNPLVVVLWALFTGYVFSTVGAAGGILAGVGHITIFGMTNANSIKPMNQFLTLVSPIISAPLYFQERRLVIPAALALGIGGVTGALFGSWASHTWMPDLATYKPVFGFVTFGIALRLFYENTPKFIERQKAVKAATKQFQDKVKELKAAGKINEIKEIGVKYDKIAMNQEFTFAGSTFKYSALSPFLAGFFIAIISAALGVGGGFLLVPFLTSVLGFPMFIVAGTSVASILVTSAASISNYIRMGSQLDFLLLSVELIGVIIGSILGPKLSKYIPGKTLKLALAVILLYIGFGYMFGAMIKAATGIKII